MQTKIPCPTCQENGIKSDIMFDPSLLLTGAQFSCPKCNTSVSLMAGSQHTYKQGLADYQSYQAQTKGLKQNGNKPL